MGPIRRQNPTLHSYNASNSAVGFFERNQGHNSMMEQTFDRNQKSNMSQTQDSSYDLFSRVQTKMTQNSWHPRVSHNYDNRMFLREARENEENKYIEAKVEKIERKMDQSKKKKIVKLRMQSENIRQKNDEHAQKICHLRKQDDKNWNLKLKKLEQAIKDRKKKVKT